MRQKVGSGLKRRCWLITSYFKSNLTSYFKLLVFYPIVNSLCCMFRLHSKTLLVFKVLRNIPITPSKIPHHRWQTGPPSLLTRFLQACYGIKKSWKASGLLMGWVLHFVIWKILLSKIKLTQVENLNIQSILSFCFLLYYIFKLFLV